MKTIKVLFAVLIVALLAGCSSDIPESIDFDRMEFSYIGVTDDDYLFYQSGTFKLELKQNDDGSIFASYEKFQDIYLIEGTEEDYQIRKNGILVQICSGEEIVCTGFEEISFSEDVVFLFSVFDNNILSTTTIFLSGLIIIAIGSLFFIPKKHLKEIKLKSFKITQVLVIRTFTILLILIGVIIIILSF